MRLEILLHIPVKITVRKVTRFNIVVIFYEFLNARTIFFIFITPFEWKNER
jgi:hypothetical protein